MSIALIANFHREVGRQELNGRWNLRLMMDRPSQRDIALQGHAHPEDIFEGLQPPDPGFNLVKPHVIPAMGRQGLNGFMSPSLKHHKPIL